MQDGLRLDIEQSGLETLQGVHHLGHGVGEAAAALGTVVSLQRCHQLLQNVHGPIGSYAHRTEVARLESLGEQPIRLHRHVDRLVGDQALLVGSSRP